MGSQVLVPFRGSEDSHRHLKLMGYLGQVETLNIIWIIFLEIGLFIYFLAGIAFEYFI